MKVLMPFPSLQPHGGTRVAVEIANQLAERGHKVLFHLLNRQGDRNYWRFHPKIAICTNRPRHDVVLITSPHSIDLAEPGHTVIHLQMLEHMFSPHNQAWVKQCERLYTYPAPLFTISQWNRRELIHKYRRDPEQTIYIGNGVSEVDFPREPGIPKDSRTVLVEGWGAYNPCKDTERLAPRVAYRLKQYGFRIVSFGIINPTDYTEVPDQFHLRPSQQHINQLYREATILLKSSCYDARSCSPVEAMTKGTPTARALIEGDDDLTNGYNCLRVPYNEDKLFVAAMDLLESPGLRENLAENGFEHLQQHCCWGPWVDLIEAKLLEVARR